MSIALGLLALAVGGNVIAVLLARARLSRLKAVAPNDFVFLFGSSRDFRAQANALKWQGGVGGPMRYKGLSANHAGLSFWQGNPPEQVTTLPWSAVLSVQDDMVSQGRISLPAVLLSYKDAAGDVQVVELANANADWLTLGNMTEVRWIVSELNSLRTGGTNARLI